MCSKTITALSFAMLAVAVASSATAATRNDEQPPRATVQFRDLNLASDEGAQALQRRVKLAARAVCARPEASWVDRVKERQCERKATDAAQPQVETALRNAGSAYAMSGALKVNAIR